MAIKSSTKIIVIDDIPSSRKTTRQALQRMGLTKVSEASDGQEAWDLLQEDDFGLVISELKVEKLNALELFTVMKSSEEHSSIPFVLMTGDSRPELIIKANEMGISGILVKPFSHQALTEVLIKIFN